MKDFFLKIWKNPVWSGVISGLILMGIPTAWAAIDFASFYAFISKSVVVFTTQVPVYYFLIGVIALLLILLLVRNIRHRKDPIWDAEIGHYTFRELYGILHGQNLPVATVGMTYSGRPAPTEDLLTQFYVYAPLFNAGITIDTPMNDGGYIHGVLAPKLVGYGIIEKIETKNLRIDMMDVTYQTSELGRKFYALIEKVNRLPK